MWERHGQRPTREDGRTLSTNNRWLAPEPFVHQMIWSQAEKNCYRDNGRAERWAARNGVPFVSVAETLEWALMVGMYFAAYLLGRSVDHILEIEEGGAHMIRNLQILTHEEHQEKTRTYSRMRAVSAP